MFLQFCAKANIFVRPEVNKTGTRVKENVYFGIRGKMSSTLFVLISLLERNVLRLVFRALTLSRGFVVVLPIHASVYMRYYTIL